MKKYTSTALGRFRAIAFLEGVSFLLLLFVAMPLKYGAGMPEAVKFTGWVHGVLFVLYCITLLNAARTLKWSLLFTCMAFVASLLPFGTFVLDAQLLKKKPPLAS